MIDISNAPRCVMCTKEMVYGCNIGTISIPVCNNQECPNYGLLQIGLDGMGKLEKEENNDK